MNEKAELQQRSLLKYFYEFVMAFSNWRLHWLVRILYLNGDDWCDICIKVFMQYLNMIKHWEVLGPSLADINSLSFTFQDGGAVMAAAGGGRGGSRGWGGRGDARLLMHLEGDLLNLKGPVGAELRCPFCGFVSRGINSRQNLHNHLLTHTGEKPFQCSVCPMRCLKKSNLKRHMLRHHPAPGSLSSTGSAPSSGSVPNSGSVPTSSTVPTSGSVPLLGSIPTLGIVPTSGSVPANYQYQTNWPMMLLMMNGMWTLKVVPLTIILEEIV